MYKYFTNQKNTSFEGTNINKRMLIYPIFLSTKRGYFSTGGGKGTPASRR